MRLSLMLEFPVSEYERRLKRLIAEMNENDIDAVILTSDENTYYFSGYNSIIWDSKVLTPGVIVITKDGDMTLSTLAEDAETARITSCVEDIRMFGEGEYDTYVKAIVSILHQKNIINGRIGLELGVGHKIHLNYYVQRELFEELKNATIVDAANVLWKVRSVKLPMEIERIRKACQINVQAVQKGLNMVEEGITENELYKNIVQECFRLGAEKSLIYGVRAGVERYSQRNCPPSDRPIQRGEMILIDGGPAYRGYYSHIIRLAVIGKPTPYQQEVFDVAREACYIGIDKVKPGVPISEVCKAVDNFMNNSKFAKINVYKNWVGHSIGVGVHECPMLDSNTHDLFEQGMTFAIEPYLYEKGVGSLGIEQNFLVTENGYEILTNSRDELIQL